MTDEPAVTTREPQPGRTSIESAAEALFIERGYVDTQLAEIAMAAGVELAALERQYPTKRDLLAKVLDRHRTALRQLFMEGAIQDPRLRLERWFTYVEDHPIVPSALFQDTTGDPDLRELHEAMRDQARAGMATALRAAVPGADPAAIDATAVALHAATVALGIYRSEHPDEPREAVVDAALRFRAAAAAGLAAGAPTTSH